MVWHSLVYLTWICTNQLAVGEGVLTATTTLMESTVKSANFITTESLQTRHASHATVTPSAPSVLSVILMDNVPVSRGFSGKSVIRADQDILVSRKLDASVYSFYFNSDD